MEITKESIFLSAIRSLLKSLFGTIGIFIVFIPIMIIMFSMSSSKQDFGGKTIPTFLPNAEGNPQVMPMTSPTILRININGVIGMDELTAETIESQLIESRQGLFKNDRVKGVLLYIDSPGGTVDDSNNIYHLVNAYKERYKVPVHAYVDGLAASGGIYVACAADYISTTPTSIIGSVGTRLGPFINVADVLQKIGVSAYTFTEGKDKDMMSPIRKWTEQDKESFNNIMAHLYEQFVDIVVKARPKITKEELINTYGAHVFDAAKSEEIGFIDNSNSYYKDAIENLLIAAKIDKSSDYQIIELKPKHKWLAELMKGKASLLHGKLHHVIQIGPREYSDKMQLFSYLYDPMYP
jgi:protease IV